MASLHSNLYLMYLKADVRRVYRRMITSKNTVVQQHQKIQTNSCLLCPLELIYYFNCIYYVIIFTCLAWVQTSK